MKRGRNIQSASDYYEWASLESANIRYLFVGAEEIKLAHAELTAITSSARKFTGIMAAHALVAVGNGCFRMRETSCFGECCFGSDGMFKFACPNWRAIQQFPPEPIIMEVDEQQPIAPPPPPAEILPEEHPAESRDVTIGDYVAAVYDGSWYIAKVLEGGERPKVTFMWPTRGGGFNWPPEAENDECIIPKEDILMSIDAPVKAHNAAVYKITKETKMAIVNSFKIL